MFKDYVFTTIMFLDYGKDNGNSRTAMSTPMASITTGGIPSPAE